MGNPFPSLKKAWPLLMIPALALILYVIFSQARGPFYLPFNYDPDYAYLFNGLNLASGIGPEHIDHPGTPLQLFTAAAIRLVNIGSSNHAMILTVLSHSESYLRGLNLAVMIGFLISLLLSGFFVWRKSGSMIAALFLQATPFLLAQDFYETVRFRPEALLLIMILALAAVLYIQVLRDEPENWIAIGLLSFLAATMLVTKINSAPFVLLPLFSLRNWKTRAGYVVLLCLFAGLWLLPLIPHYHRFVTWVLGLVTHKERYGTGDPGWFPHNFASRLTFIIGQRPIFLLTVLLSVATVARGWIFLRGKMLPQEARLTRLLAGLVFADILEYVMVGKFEQARYLVPAMTFCGLNWVILFALAQHWKKEPIKSFASRAIGIGACIFVVSVSASVLRHRYEQMIESRDTHTEMMQVVEREYGDKILVYYYGCSSLYHALWFGNAYTGRRYGHFITDLFPNHSSAYMVEIFPDKNYWYSVAGPDILLHERLDQGDTLYFVGREWIEGTEREVFNFLTNNVSIVKERAMGEEAVYRVKAFPAIR